MYTHVFHNKWDGNLLIFLVKSGHCGVSDSIGLGDNRFFVWVDIFFVWVDMHVFFFRKIRDFVAPESLSKIFCLGCSTIWVDAFADNRCWRCQSDAALGAPPFPLSQNPSRNIVRKQSIQISQLVFFSGDHDDPQIQKWTAPFCRFTFLGDTKGWVHRINYFSVAVPS